MKKLFSEIPFIEGERVVLRAITQDDADSLRELTESETVYRYLPTFLFEKKYDSIEYVIDHLYDECFRESIILGISLKDDETFCGIAEMYGFRDDAHKISIGLRTTERSWGKEIGVKVIGMMVDYLYGETDIEIITASTMIDNRAVAKMVAKTDLELVVHDSPEDWGYEEPTRTDKWIV